MTNQDKQPQEQPLKKPRPGHGEGSIYQEGSRSGKKDGRWRADITLENGKRKTLYGKTRKEVADKLNTTLHEQKQGIVATGQRQTVATYLHYWLEEIHKTAVKISTYAMYRRNIDTHIIPALGHIQIQKLTVDQVQAFCAKMSEQGLASGTVRLLYTILHTALQDAVRWRRLSINVCDAVKLPRQRRREGQPLNQEQARRLVQTAQGSRLECILILALTTEMRLGEILALRWSDINLEGRVLHVRRTVDYIKGHGWVESEPKTEEGERDIQLPQVTVEALRKHHTSQGEARRKAGARWKEQGLVFPNRDGGYFRRMRLYAIFKTLLQEAGLPDIRFHDTRHSTATILLGMVPPTVVQAILGQRNVTTTMNIYGHVFPSMQREAMDTMDDLFGGTP